MRMVALLTSALTAAALVTAAPAAQATEGVTLDFLGATVLPNALQFQGTTVGGLSAISYDARTGQYFLISDDRSAKNPARFYTARIAVSTSGAPKVALTSTKPWLQKDGTVFPPTAGTTVAPDPEGLAVDPRSGKLFWSSEGERIVPATGAPTIGQPWIRVASRDGAYRGDVELPKQFTITAEQKGPRQNQVLEGLSFTPDGRRLYAGIEDPLFQDGPVPTPTKGALTRITEFDPKTRKPVAQFAYPLEKLFAMPPNADSTDTNGLTDVLALGNGTLLITERASIFQTNNWKVRLYLADTSGATNVLGQDTISGTPMRKKLLLDLSDVPDLKLDNFEGATLGPRLPDGRRSLILVTDDNFNTAEITEFTAFAISGV
ncbi:esterase-like activity of phytase family protein [Cryptosporangium sp. NPDC048952]|uniref:esterase-like activity of phytase family protein n=1 Tax=Cryptosporangium sp. NPDC048952 TaxID=3363961 RepID=UPI00371FB76B